MNNWFDRLRKALQGRSGALAIVILLLFGLTWETTSKNWSQFSQALTDNDVRGIFLGRLPAPVEPSITNTVITALARQEKYRLMTIRHIPRIRAGEKMLHPYVGDCRHCHLYQGGPGPGSQQKTPVGALLEKLSQVHKLGPPLQPTSEQPHPQAGRCIKCHDIVVKVPVEKSKNGFLWNL